MTLGQLKEAIDQFIDEGRATEDTQVRIAEQPSYPLQSSIAGVATLHDALTDADQEREEEGRGDPDPQSLDDVENIAYIVSGSQISSDPYANSHLWNVAEGSWG